MPALVNAQRRINKATYVSIRADEQDDVELTQKRLIRRPLEKINYLRSLGVGRGEFAGIKSMLDDGRPGDDRDVYLRLLDVTAAIVLDTSPLANVRLAPRVARISPDALAGFGRVIAASRRNVRRQVQATIGKIHARYAEQAGDGNRPMPAASASITPSGAAGFQSSTHADATANALSGSRRNAGFGSLTRLGSATAVDGEAPRTRALQGDGHSGVGASTALPSAKRPTEISTLRWAIGQGDPDAIRLTELIQSMSTRLASAPVRGLAADQPIESALDGLDSMAALAEESASAFVEQFAIEPVGRLHLERLVFMPVGVERGELVYSIPLAPLESVNISHKEWSVRSEEFETIVQDAFEEFSEEGVSEKNDLSQSTDSQQRHATAFSLSGSYSGYGASVTVGYNSTSEDQQARKDSRQQSITMTRKASTRAKREHKQSFKVNAVVGAEDQSVRVITNPSSTDAMRVDYYQLMRKWQVDLFRYDLRMTYDIVIPSPGVDLLQKLDELRVLDEQIGSPFRFDLPLDEIDRDSWATYAAEFKARVNEPPTEFQWLELHREYPYKSDDDAKHAWFDGLDIEIDPDYQIYEGWFNALFATKSDHRTDANFDVGLDEKEGVHGTGDLYVGYSSRLEHLKGRSGSLALTYGGNWTSGGYTHVRFRLYLRPEAYERWRFEAWSAMREGAEEVYFASRQTRIERRDALAEELKGWDALTLRRMEREEIMKGVLRWLLGPSFELVPADIESFFGPIVAATAGPGAAAAGHVAGSFRDARAIGEGVGAVALPGDELVEPRRPGAAPGAAGSDVTPVEGILPTEENWERVMRFGEMIKFLHHAIEWENVLYFTYPYFWDSPDNWDFKRFLQHPDPLHREFLRAGSARVVLTVRPGFEVDFTEFVESGALGDDHPYLTIAQEIQNYARTNYPGIPPANSEVPSNEEEVDEREYGELIGRWYEYTPTSALDLSLNTVLADLA